MPNVEQYLRDVHRWRQLHGGRQVTQPHMWKVSLRQLLRWNRKRWHDGGKFLGNSKDIANNAEEKI